MLTGDTAEAVQAVVQVGGGEASDVTEPAPAPEPTPTPAGKKKKKTGGWRAAAARRLEEAKASATKFAEGVGDKAAEVQQSAAVSMANARTEMERRRLEGRVAKEDKYAMAWRTQCMAELDDEGAARERVVAFGARGVLEVDNPMALRALSTVDVSCTAFATRLEEQATLTEEMAAQADAVAEQSAAVLRATEKEIVQMMAQSEREGGVTAEHTAAIIDACGEAASLRGWSSAVRASLTERAAQCGEKQQVDLKQVRSEFIVTTSAMRESMKEMLKERTEEGFDEKLAVFDSKRRLAEASRAKLTQALISSRTQAYVTPVEQMVGFVEAQKEFFRQGLAAMEALQPSVDALRERAAAAEAEAEATGQSLTALMERLQQIDESDEPVFEPVPDGRVLKAGISLLGKHLGPPQHQGFLYQSGLRRWCVLVNGKLYEYADDWLAAPLKCTNMFLCNAKQSGDPSLRFGIELLSMAPGDFDPKKGPPKPTTYQALNADDMAGWLQVITECTEFMITHQPSGKEDEAVEEDPQVVSIRSIAGNSTCADCPRPSPEWVSISLGTTICTECSGAHRGLGVHISKVQSLALDRLEEGTLELLKGTGNEFCNSLWESGGVPEGVRPTSRSSREELAEFVTRKYKLREFVSEDLTAAVSGNGNALAEAAASGDVHAVARSLVGGGRVNVVAPFHAASGKTILMVAIESGSQTTLELVINSSPDLGAADADGRTAMHHAVAAKRTAALGLLVKRGAWAHLDTADKNGDTPRSLAEALDISDLDEAEASALREVMATASELAESQKLQETRMAAGKVFYEAGRLLPAGHIAEAITALERGAEMEPDHADMQLMLEQAREMQTVFGDEAEEEQVESWMRKYKLKQQASEFKAKISSKASSAAAGVLDAATDFSERKSLAEYTVEGKAGRSGWMAKRATHRTDAFKRRWFELRGTDLAYFDAEGGKIVGLIDLAADIQGVSPNAAETDSAAAAADGPQWDFEIVSAEQTYFMRCDDEEAREGWLGAIQQAIESASAAPEEEPAVEEGVPPGDAAAEPEVAAAAATAEPPQAGKGEGEGERAAVEPGTDVGDAVAI